MEKITSYYILLENTPSYPNDGRNPTFWGGYLVAHTKFQKNNNAGIHKDSILTPPYFFDQPATEKKLVVYNATCQDNRIAICDITKIGAVRLAHLELLLPVEYSSRLKVYHHTSWLNFGLATQEGDLVNVNIQTYYSCCTVPVPIQGIVRYKGNPNGCGIMFGIELPWKCGNTNGTPYFTCPEKHGVLVSLERLSPIESDQDPLAAINGLSVNDNIISVSDVSEGDSKDSPSISSQTCRKVIGIERGENSNFYNNSSLSDVVIIVNGIKYHGHKFFLAKFSDVFEKMLYDENWKVGDALEVTESLECSEWFSEFLKYFYFHSVVICVENCSALYTLADKYNVESLKTSCLQYMVDVCNSTAGEIAFENAAKLMPFAKRMNLMDLLSNCKETIRSDIDAFISTKIWLEFDIDLLTDILLDPDICVHREINLYRAISEYLLLERNQECRAAYFDVLLRIIRFPLMSSSDLWEVEHSELVQQKDCDELLSVLLADAYRFVSLAPYSNQMKVKETFTGIQYQARNLPHKRLRDQMGYFKIEEIN